jgi:predicted RNA-binding Zn-ribbon protein involved in translation (DUF1610 family)
VGLDEDKLIHENYECTSCGAAWTTSHNEVEYVEYCCFCGSDAINQTEEIADGYIIDDLEQDDE